MCGKFAYSFRKFTKVEIQIFCNQIALILISEKKKKKKKKNLPGYLSMLDFKHFHTSCPEEYNQTLRWCNNSFFEIIKKVIFHNYCT
jgi:hypothetical protein